MTGEGEEVGDGRDKGLSAVGDGGKAAMSLTSDTDGTHTCIFENSQLEGSYVGIQHTQNDVEESYTKLLQINQDGILKIYSSNPQGGKE